MTGLESLMVLLEDALRAPGKFWVRKSGCLPATFEVGALMVTRAADFWVLNWRISDDAARFMIGSNRANRLPRVEPVILYDAQVDEVFTSDMLGMFESERNEFMSPSVEDVNVLRTAMGMPRVTDSAGHTVAALSRLLDVVAKGASDER